MSNPAQNPIPHGMHSLTPHLVCAGAADAIEFYKKAFGTLEDPFGHHWSVATHVRDVTPEEMNAAMKQQQPH